LSIIDRIDIFNNNLFRLEKMSYLLKDFGVSCVKDLADLYGSADLIADVENCLSQIEMKRFKKAAALTSCLAGESFPTLGESLLEEVEALNKVLEKSMMESRSATGATAVRIDNLTKELEKLKSKVCRYHRESDRCTQKTRRCLMR
jgi:3-keto-L-gulonate-6-phosphate decarboxylase